MNPFTTSTVTPQDLIALTHRIRNAFNSTPHKTNDQILQDVSAGMNLTDFDKSFVLALIESARMVAP
jgi:hypothetical protein